MQSATETLFGEASIQQPCPQCGTMIPVNPNYVMWCDQCSWNLRPEQSIRPKTRLEALYLTLGQKLSASLFATLATSPVCKPTWTRSKVLALVVASLVHLTTLMLTILGLLMIFRTGFNLLLIGLGLFCLSIAWQIRPRLASAPPNIAQPSLFPTLYAVTNRISQALGGKPIQAIVIDSHFNASFQQVGIRSAPVVTVGLPLFMILTPQERVAILAHEIAHGVNGDPNRNLFIHSALHALLSWHDLLQPDYIQRRAGRVARGSTAGFLALIGNSIALVVVPLLAAIPWLFALVLTHLLWRDSQRAEYMADLLAARAGGTEAMLSALEKLHYTRAFQHTMQQITVGQSAADWITTLRQTIAMMPPREVERIRRIETLRAARLDVTHPPTMYRVQLLRSRPVTQPAISISPAEAEQLEQELLTLRTHIQRELIDSYRTRLYY